MARPDFNPALAQTNPFDDGFQQGSLGLRRTTAQRGSGKIAGRDGPLDRLGTAGPNQLAEKLLIDEQFGDALTDQSLKIES